MSLFHTSKLIEKNGVRIGIIFLPYIHFDVLVNIAKEKNIPIDQDQHNYKIAQHIFENYIKQLCEGDLRDCDKKILLGHYYLDGASFCFTGKLETMNRVEVEQLVKDNGGVAKSGVVKNLTHLVTNSTEQTVKFKKAQEQGSKIITEEEFLKMIE